MAVTAAQAGGGRAESPKGRKTRLNETTDEPSFVAPGDGPADTLDRGEFATSVPADKAAAARAGFGVVNAVVPLPKDSAALGRGVRGAGGGGDERTEAYEVTGPNGKPVRVERNIETGESKVS
jgi:hypothetical protein